MDTTELTESAQRLTRDLADAAATLSDDEARFLVDSYYAMQEDRIRANNQVRALGEGGEPHDVLRWLAAQSDLLENQIKRALGRYAGASPIGRWCQLQKGVGPVIAAGLLAHLSIRPWRCALSRGPGRSKACRESEPHGPECRREVLHTAGHFWRFAGLDPTLVWEKGQKRPFNAQLKTLCWKIGESFVKVSGDEQALYGQLYALRKKLEVERNEAGAFRAQAEEKLAKFKIGKATDAYAAYSRGRLPPAHLHARAKRYAVKIFLAHLHEVWYRYELRTDPPRPYVLEHLGHAHKIEPTPRDAE